MQQVIHLPQVHKEKHLQCLAILLKAELSLPGSLQHKALCLLCKHFKTIRLNHCYMLSSVSCQVGSVSDRDVKRNTENRISVLEIKSGSTLSANEIRIYLFLIFVKDII